MKKRLVLTAVFGMTLALGLALAGCKGGDDDDTPGIIPGGGGGTSTSYTYTSGMYVMTITKTNSAKSFVPMKSMYPSLVRAALSPGETALYTLKYNGIVRSTGTVIMGTDDAATFTPASGKPAFTAAFSGENALKIAGTVILDDGTTAPLNSMGGVTGQVAAFAEYWGIWNATIDGTHVTLTIGAGVWEIWIGSEDHGTGIYTQTSETTANIIDTYQGHIGVVKTGANVTMTITLNSNSYYPGTYNLTR